MGMEPPGKPGAGTAGREVALAWPLPEAMVSLILCVFGSSVPKKRRRDPWTMFLVPDPEIHKSQTNQLISTKEL